MTNGKSAAAWAKAQTGTPYDEMDCIRLIVEAIRKGEGASGESLTYRCGGCNELWRSLHASGKYRYVTRRLELESAQALGTLLPGALVAIWTPGHNEKYEDDEGNCEHIGMYVGDKDCEVIHASATKGKVCASTLENGWTHVLIHRLIDLEDGQSEELDYTPVDPYSATVATEKDPLTIREKPTTQSRALGKVRKGGKMTVVGHVQVDSTGRAWLPVEAMADNRRSMVRGFAACEYLAPDEDAVTQETDVVAVPRALILALADALGTLDRACSANSAAYEDAVTALMTAAQGVTPYLRGDD